MSVVINTITKLAFTFGNIGLIQRILKNLMRNAIRFTPKGGSMTLSIRERFESIAVAVTDPGAEIAYNDIFKNIRPILLSCIRRRGEVGFVWARARNC